MYGPSELSTMINDSKIQIHQKTNYPLSDKITYELSMDSPQEFTFYFRKPNWSTKLNFSEKSNYENGYYSIKKRWKNGDTIELSFENTIEVKEFQNGENYFQRGPIVYAYEIPHTEESIKDYEIEGFRDYYCFPSNDDYKTLTSKGDNSDFVHINNNPNPINPWYSGDYFIEGNLFDQKTMSTQQKKLVPMGSTVLRKVSFSKSK